MTLTTRSMGWLNQNRYRAYPFRNDEGLIQTKTDLQSVTGVAKERIPDCVLLDALVIDTRKESEETSLVATGYTVAADSTQVSFTYGGESFTLTLTGGAISGEKSFNRISGNLMPKGAGWTRPVQISLVFSSHACIHANVAEGTYAFTGTVLPTRIVRFPGGSGIDGLATNGSTNVQAGGTATGTVVLEDGYRTMPVIQNGRVFVRVGPNYGLDPCHYAVESSSLGPGCDELLFFFCGQNAVNSGNVVLRGGPGVNVTQGRSYLVTRAILNDDQSVAAAVGEKIPAIEITATSDLLGLYRPATDSSDSSSSSQTTRETL